MKKISAALGLSIVLVLGAACGAAASNTDNDRVLNGEKGDFIEYYKQDDSHGDKNYVYTESEFTDKWGRHCTVVTGDSEQTIALSCQDGGR